jgi:hypothetical protein
MTRTSSPETPVSDDERIFDLLEPLSKALIEAGGPNIRGGFARATGGVDIPFIVEALTKRPTPSADVSSLEKVARAMHSEMLAMENEDGGEGCEFDETTPEQRAMLDRLARAAIAAYDTEAAIVLKRLETENERLTALLNTPEVEDWAKGAVLEAGHQRERWGADHDAGKSPFDWFWLVGYLAQKAAASAVAGDVEKAKHHTISTGAALANWHLALSGTDNRMVPGAPLPIVEQGEATVSALEPGCGEPWICAPCDAVNNDIRQRCRFCKKPRSEVARSKQELE